MMDLEGLQTLFDANGLSAWTEQLPAQIEKGLDHRRYGDLAHWQQVVQNLPRIHPSSCELNQGRIRIGSSNDVNEELTLSLKDELKKLHPWRKGPFELFGIHINTEWRSDWKWDRLKDHISPLKDRLVLDVGCGNGYHCWRMFAQGASQVIGIDPTPLFVMQFEAMRHFIGKTSVNVLPFVIDDVPTKLEAFDTVFSMGVLYHRRSPLDHLLQLRDCLKPGGELVLETLIIDGDSQHCLMPVQRYAQMGNVWFLPSVAMLEIWLQRCKFTNIHIVNINQTTTDEQRSTEWMHFQSLADFLDPEDRNKTVEGYPAPKRVIVVASKPA